MKNIYSPHSGPPLLYGSWIEGSLINSAGPKTTIYNPFDRTPIGQVPELNDELVNEAISQAHLCFTEWKKSTGHSRAKLLRAIAAALRLEEDLLAQTITLEQGKPLIEARAEVAYSAAYLDWFAGEAERIRGEILDGPDSTGSIQVRFEPVGVAALITPWNFPLAMITRKAAAAWAAGCSVVCKPAPETPFTALRFAAIATASGLPAGALQIITGDAPRIGDLLLSSPLVRKLSFTGSTAIGKLLMAKAAQRMIRPTLELGGNAPFIVWDDADLEQAARDGAAAKFRNSGQTCISVNRFFVHRSVVEPFVKLLSEQAEKLRPGNGFDPETTLGPLTQPNRHNILNNLVNDALSSGATCSFGTLTDPAQSIMPPIILTDITDTMRITKEEIFGPVCSILVFDEDEEVITRANASPAGLIAYAYTSSAKRLEWASQNLEAGMIGLNQTRLSLVHAPFGGIKESGIGREGHSMGMREYQNVKYCSG
jgi:succinate-semialdehyde dehydrogenase/glutarate-semialdehyde dehydrogenase